MNVLACQRAGVLLERRRAGLSSADRLRLEEHLGACTSCSAEARALSALARLWHEHDAALDVAARERALARALESRERDFYRTPGWTRRRSSIPLVVAAAAAAVISLTYFQHDTAPASSAARHAAASMSARDSVVLEGTLQDGEGRLLSAGSPVAPRGTLFARQDARVALNRTVLTLDGGTRTRWQGPEHVLRLEDGNIIADQSATRAERLTVRTDGFAVVALGARFEMSPTTVSVYRGKVRVLAEQGRTLELAAGATWPAADGPDTRARPHAASQRPEPDETPAAQRLLRRARAQLADGRFEEAARALRAARRTGLRPSLRAEALSLEAEHALLAGEPARATRLYLRVAERYRSSPAGDNALFVAARIAADRGHVAQARRLLQRYLARYPRGRFQTEARKRLSQLVP